MITEERSDAEEELRLRSPCVCLQNVCLMSGPVRRMKTKKGFQKRGGERAK